VPASHCTDGVAVLLVLALWYRYNMVIIGRDYFPLRREHQKVSTLLYLQV